MFLRFLTFLVRTKQQTKQHLRQLLTLEDRRRRDFARNAPSRHSRFGTTISVRLNPKKTATATGEAEDHPVAPDDNNGPSSQPLVLHRQQALSQHSAAGDVIDLTKRQHRQKGKKEDEVSRRDDLSPEARTVLRGLARTFVESCFNRAHSFSFSPMPLSYRSLPRISLERLGANVKKT